MALVNAPDSSRNGPDDIDFVRAREFLDLRAEQREHEDLNAKRREVQAVVENFSKRAGGNPGH